MSSKLQQITIRELLNKLDNPSTKIIDVRPVEAYNGGWIEWSNNPENPYQTGVPVNQEGEINK